MTLNESRAVSVKRLLVVSTEDSTKLRSWSNVPYLFCRNLELQEIELCRLTLKQSVVGSWFVRVLQGVLRLLGGKSTTWTYSRASWYVRRAQGQIDQALKETRADAVLVLSFSYGPSLPVDVPLFLFGDWTLGYAIEIQRNRTADKFEQRAIDRELDLIGSADGVFVLFPIAEQYLRQVLPNAKSHYLGNVINAVAEPSEEDLKQKLRSQTLLFVGKPHYLEGARHLIEAYRSLKPKYPNLSVEIVGMESHFFENLPAGVTCHGYLDKGNDLQRQLYYCLLRSARVFINTTPGWSSFSAMLEALYFYTPTITSRYPEVVETLGRRPNCGTYYEEGLRPLADLIEDFLAVSDYEGRAIAAHEATKKFTWSCYVSDFLDVANRAVMKRNEIRQL